MKSFSDEGENKIENNGGAGAARAARGGRTVCLPAVRGGARERWRERM